jgi:hypothetical protein
MNMRDADPTHPEPTHPAPAHPANAHPVGASPPAAGRGFLDRLRLRRRERERRRRLAGRNRVVHRVEMLGPNWHIVDYHPDDPDFLAIGPGGIFQVTVADIGRARVEIAGEVVQISGRRPPYVALARRDAARISEQMSAAAGRRIPVVPVVAFHGRGKVVYYGKPQEGCVVTTYGDLGRALNAHGNRVRESTIQKLLIVAAHVDSTTVGQYLHISGEAPSQRGTAR